MGLERILTRLQVLRLFATLNCIGKPRLPMLKKQYAYRKCTFEYSTDWGVGRLGQKGRGFIREDTIFHGQEAIYGPGSSGGSLCR